MDYTYQYKKWHEDTENHYNEMEKYYFNTLKPFLPSINNLNILEIGCGMGFAVSALNKNGYERVLGIDIDEKQIEICQNKNFNCLLVKDTTEFLNDKIEQFDIIIMLDVLEHILKDEQMDLLSNCFKSLKKGGKIIIKVPNANSLIFSRYRYDDWTHQISFTEHSLDFILYNSGFSKIEILPDDLSYRPRFPFIIRKSLFTWYLKSFFRFIKRLILIGELGSDQAKSIPLSLNIIAVASKE